MEVLTPDRILTLAGFLGVLVLLWAAIRLYRAPLAARLKPAGQPLKLAGTLPLGGDTRALLMRVEGQSVLVVTGRKSGTSLIALHGAAAAPGTDGAEAEAEAAGTRETAA